MRGAARSGQPVIVLDRPNPINGIDVEGPLVEPGSRVVRRHRAIPVRHGLTTGELARYVNAERGLGADLTVIPMQDWRREMWFDQTGLPWVPLSPGMPQLATAIVYPGMCLVEGTNLSEGRGTALPFEVVGAPWWRDTDWRSRSMASSCPACVSARCVLHLRRATCRTDVQWRAGARDGSGAVQAGCNGLARHGGLPGGRPRSL